MEDLQMHRFRCFNKNLAATFVSIFSDHSKDVQKVIEFHLKEIQRLLIDLGPKGPKGGESATETPPTATEPPKVTAPPSPKATEDAGPSGEGPSGSNLNNEPEETEEEKKKRLERENKASEAFLAKEIAEAKAKQAQEDADERFALELADYEKSLVSDDPEPKERGFIGRNDILTVLSSESIHPVTTMAVPSNLQVLDLPIYGDGRVIYMMDSYVPSPGQTTESLQAMELKRAEAFYAHFLHSPEELAVRSKVRGASKPLIRMFMKSRYVEFVITRWDNSSMKVTSGDFPHMNPLDLFECLKLYSKPGTKSTIAIRHHKRQLTEFLKFYTYDFGVLDAVIQPLFFGHCSPTPPPPNKATDDLLDVQHNFTERPTKAVLYKLKSNPSLALAFRFNEKHLYTNAEIRSISTYISSMRIPDAKKQQLIGELEWFIEVRKVWLEMVEFLSKIN